MATLKYKASNGSYVPINVFANQLQSDWNQTDTTAKDFIKNKPTIVISGFQLTTSETTGADVLVAVGTATIVNDTTTGTDVFTF